MLIFWLYKFWTIISTYIYTLMEFADALLGDDTIQKKLILNLCNSRLISPLLVNSFPPFEILWHELKSDSSSIDHLLSPFMLDRLAEVISNGGAPMGYAYWFCA